jgi:CHAT domain-containing protein
MAITSGCKWISAPSPDSVYNSIFLKVRLGDFDTALQDVQRARQRYASKSVEWDWRFRVLQAQILVSRSEYKAGLALLNEELPVQLRSSDIDTRKEMVEGIGYRYAQRFDDSEKHLERAKQLAATPDLLCQILNAQGALAVDENNYAAAEALFRRALSLAREKKLSWSEASALGNLGRVATSQGHFDEALDWDHSALQLAQSLRMNGTASAILGNMAWAYRKLGDFDNALAFGEQAEDASVQTGLIGNQIYWLTGISNVYYEQHDYERAAAVLARALNLARKQDDRRTLVEFLNDLGEIALEIGETENAEKYWAEAVQIEEAGLDRSGVVASTLVHGRIDENKRAYEGAERAFLKVIGDSRADAAQKWEAHARLAQTYANEGQFGKADKEFRRSLETVESVRSSVQAEDLRLSFLSSAIDFHDDYIQFLISRGREKDALQVAELSRARTLEEGLATDANKSSASSSDLEPQRLAKRLNAALLFYWIGHSQSHLWVITPEKIAHFALPKASEIEPVVKSYEKTVLGMRYAQDAGNGDGKRLYEMLVEPAKKLIAQGARVNVLPDESLYGLNFETLVVPDPQPHFWIEDVTLTTASSLTLLGRSTREARTKEKNLLLVGNTEQASADFPSLPQATAEMQKIERYFPEAQRRILAGKQATPTAYLNGNPERYAYLHFVTHGTASHIRPLESAVILSKEGDSYKLYARDIVTHHLNANLVTISACNGSGTRAYSGEGLVGLSWAFLRAGAHNVIGALWEVSDASTPQLMDGLYLELSQGKDPATALRDAKLSLLHSPDANSVFRKPFYWAPFQLYTGS